MQVLKKLFSGADPTKKAFSYFTHVCKIILQICVQYLLKKNKLPGVGSKPGSSQFNLFSHFHHFTADPQRLPTCKIPYKFVKNESYQIFTNICTPNLAYFTSNFQINGSKWLKKTLSYQTILNKSNIK
jgi:hypothetical protein